MIHDFEMEKIFDYRQDINFLVKSEIRLKILGILYSAPASIKEIEAKTGLSYTSIMNNINKLVEKNYIYGIEDRFHLYTTTKIKIIHMVNFNKSSKFLNEFSDFLNNSLIDIRMDTIKDLSALEGSKLIKSSNFDLFKVSEVFHNSFIGFKFLKCIFPYFHQDYEEIISYVIEHDCTAEMILPDEVSEVGKNFIREYVSKNPEIRNKVIKLKPNDADIKFALIVNDKRMVLAFYRKDGQFNQNAALVSTNPEAIDFGLKLYEECEKLCGEYVSLENILYPNGGVK